MSKKSKTKIPEGYESMEMTWTVDPQKSAMHLMSSAPVGWRAIGLDRNETMVVVTYIRPREIP